MLTCYGCAFGIWSRLQEPKERPYRVETVRFEGGGSDVRLEGELTMPYGTGPFSAVVLISGSGPQDRNELVEGHKPFLVLSDHLTRSGYAVLRYDDRGVAQSSGEYSTATAKDFAADAAAAFSWLQRHPHIAPSRIGFLGHSEGGYIAPLAADMVGDAAFMIFMAGPAKPLLPDVMIDQNRDILRSSGATEALVNKAHQQVVEVTQILRTSTSVDEAKVRMKAYLKAEDLSFFEIRANLNLWATPWGMWYADYDPAPAYKIFRGPVLALYGGTDLQVSASENAPLMSTMLTHSMSEVCTFPGLNHLFQPSDSGKIEEYSRIDITIDEKTLHKIVDWMNRLNSASESIANGIHTSCQ